MRVFPLKRTKLSNMNIMTILFGVLLLYRIPSWVQAPATIWDTLILLLFALTVDEAAGYIRHKRPVCAVSGAVTAVLLQLLTPGVPLWGQFIGVAFALVAGKHIWGGTGKNPINPAVTGLLLLALLFNVQFPLFSTSPLLIPAILLSLPFLLFRPFAALGMMAGMAAALALRPEPMLPILVESGAVLWGCLIITDPVTTTPRPLAGAVIGLFTGFIPVVLGGSATAMAASVLFSNLLSFAADRLNLGDALRFRPRFKQITIPRESVLFHDLAGTDTGDVLEAPASAEAIVERIERAGVFGFGGAAFPTGRKIRTVMASMASDKHLIINAVECDPGLIHDKWLLQNRADDIIRGIELLCRCVPFSSVTVAAKCGPLPVFPDPIITRRMPNFYPVGSERVLIREVLNASLTDGVIPAEAGILVVNVQTVIAIYKAVLGHMAETRYLTVANLRTNEAAVARVRLSANAREILHKIFPTAAPVFVGGGMMQAKIAADDTTVDQSVNFIAASTIPEYRESPQCSRCGLCVAVCPAGLAVADIVEHLRTGQAVKAAKLHPERCMACGACSRVCLAGRNLSEAVQRAKS